MDYVQKIRKTPIVVNDSRGFYTAACFGTFIRKASHAGGGHRPGHDRECARIAGMPVGPLALNDEVAIDLSWKIIEQTKRTGPRREVRGVAAPRTCSS